MKKLSFFLILFSSIFVSCKSITPIFTRKTPHEVYGEKLEDKRMDRTPEGRAWLAASKLALEQAQNVQLPYNHIGVFPADRPKAIALSFSANRGERILFRISRKEGEKLNLFADIFKADGGSRQVFSAEPGQPEFAFNVEESGNYMIRLQPRLGESGEYTLVTSVGPSLDFPVSGSQARTGSFWGDARDGGKRKHEGIDIFAPKGTPVLASTDGVITGVRDGGIGGKTVWLRPEDRNITLYYAHLDEQLVHEGQRVKKGHVIGKVGNTGNAKTTPPHLHFGVYTYGGAVDPLPYVKKDIRTAATVQKKDLDKTLKLVKTHTTDKGEVVKQNTFLDPLAVNAKGYFAETPEGIIIFIPFSSVKPATSKELNNVASSVRESSKRSE